MESRYVRGLDKNPLVVENYETREKRRQIFHFWRIFREIFMDISGLVMIKDWIYINLTKLRLNSVKLALI